MRLTTKGEYAVRSVINLLSNPANGPVRIRDIADSEGISKAYIEQLFNRLRKDGLIKSVRGPAGGYILAKKPEKITIGDIIRSVEGPIFLTLCSSGKTGCCDRERSCRSLPMWKKINKRIESALDSIDLGDLK